MNETVPDDSTATPADKAGPVILQVLPSLVTGGVERGTIDVARAVIESGGTALVASAGGIMTAELARAGATHFELPLHSKNPLVMRRNIDRLCALIREHEVDLIHARSRAPAWSALFAARRSGIPFVTTFHGNYGAANPIKRLYNSVMARGDRVIAISQFIADQIINRYGGDPARIRVIPRGVDFTMFDPEAVTGSRLIQLAEQWRVPEDHRVILLPGRLTRWKGQSVLIEAMSRLPDRTGLRCILVGSAQGRDAYVKELEDDIARAGLGDTVHIAGDCRDMPAAMLMADVVISTSVEAEAFGRVIVEAQAMGRPVIATDHGAARETVQHNETGWLVPPDNADALAAMLMGVLDLDPADRQAVARRAMESARANYTKDLMCARTLSVYDEAIAEKGGA